MTTDQFETQNQDRIKRALALPESDELDFKRVSNVNKIIKTACAMANNKGGWIALGIEDPNKAQEDDRLYGIEEIPECLGEIKRDLRDRLSPPLAAPHCADPQFHELSCKLRDGKRGTIVLVKIPYSNVVHSLVNGGTYTRVESQNRHLTAAEITELSLRRGTKSAVDAPVDIPIALLETDWWREYAEARQLTRPMTEQLKHLGLCKKMPDDSWRPTIASILLFAESPGGLLDRKCAIRILHYGGHQEDYEPDTSLIRPPVTVDGPVLYQIRQATTVVLSKLESGVQVSPAGLEIRQQYPRRVIQEAITNAVIHRDYRISQDIQIRIYANRIEVESPGVFPGAVTVDQLPDVGSCPRNRAIVDHLREFPIPPNLDAGEGVRMMFHVLDERGLYPPIYKTEAELGKEMVQLHLLNEAKQPDWDLVSDYLRQHKTVTNADVRRILNLQNTVKASKRLRSWVKSGLLIVANPHEGTKKRCYRRSAATNLIDDLMRLLLSSTQGKQSQKSLKI